MRLTPARTQDNWLSPAARRRLHTHAHAALRRARRDGRPALASISVRLAGALDPGAAILGARQAGEPWFCMEQPERDGWALGALGQLIDFGEGRFAEADREWREWVRRAVMDPLDGPPGSGLMAAGGFAFAAGGSVNAAWSGFGSGSLLIPVLSLTRQGEATWLTVTLLLGPDDLPETVVSHALARVSTLTDARLPMLDPSPAVSPVVRSVMPPSHYEEAVARAVTRIRNGEMEKVVLGREVEVQAAAPFDPAAVLGVLRQAFPGCFVYAVGRGETTFLGASPELLVRREGSRASTVALAGSARRSADPAVDDHLAERLLRSDKERAENAIVARRITRSLAPLSVWVTAAPEPSVIKVANIQHLAAPIRAQLARPLGAVELAGLLHPTPAVGGEPWSVAESVIPALEGFDRGWYAGPVGWVDSAGDGEFCVALRCALLHESTARLYAGAGIVAESDPAAELAETEVKLGALLPILSG